MRIRGTYRLSRIVRSIRERIIPKALVLMYHRVIELPSNPYLLCVTPDHFAEHLEVIGKRYRAVTVEELGRALEKGSLKRGTVAVTFDDGYSDNLHNALPLLERFDIPGTVFIATGQIGSNREFWWDELEKIVLSPGFLPASLDIREGDRRLSLDLNGARCFNEEEHAGSIAWNYGWAEDPTPRHGLFRTLYGFLDSLENDRKLSALDRLSGWAERSAAARPSHRAMTADEVGRLAASKMIETGAHTVTHPVLARLPLSGQRLEIGRSKAGLEEMTGRPVASFSYPHGLVMHYTAETVALVREAGFKCACSAFPGVTGSRTDRFQLPRFQIEDYDGDEFARRLDRWFGLSGVI